MAVKVETRVMLEALRSGMHPREASKHYGKSVGYMYSLCQRYHIAFKQRKNAKQ